MNINEATEQFERWMRSLLLAKPPGPDDEAIKFKHTQIVKDGSGDGKASAFPFLRATFYRWVQRWNEEAGKLADAPKVLAVGDLHIENFGTWRDAHGRLIWGINDFDEAWELPWTSDLVRLGVSASLAVRDGNGFSFKTEEVCEWILDGYKDGLKDNATLAFDLEAGHDRLRKMIEHAFKDAGEFWKEFDDSDTKWKKTEDPPAGAKAALSAVAPDGATLESFREQRSPYDGSGNKPSGLGSLGRSRFCLLARNDGAKSDSIDKGRLVREAKVVLPSAVVWATGVKNAEIKIAPLLAARPCPDPWMQLLDGWIARRIAPDAVKVSLKKLTKGDFEPEDEEKLFHAMGRETANVHLASGRAADVLRDLRQRSEDDKEWFKKAVKNWREKVEEDWQAFDPKKLAK